MNPVTSLGVFYNNETEREAVREFFIETLKEMAVDRAFSGEDTYGIKEAKSCIEKAFDRLEELYGKIQKPIINNSK